MCASFILESGGSESVCRIESSRKEWLEAIEVSVAW